MTNPDLCFSLRLQAAAAADGCVVASKNFDGNGDLAPIIYEFMTEAFLTYEAEITDSSAQKNAMIKIIGILLSCNCFEKSDYEALITKTTQYAARLLKKTDQCIMVLECSHLFFKDEVSLYWVVESFKAYIHFAHFSILFSSNSTYTKTLNVCLNVFKEL
jgi:hypothetical protein